MKMQLITIRPDKFGIENGFKIKRELFDECGFIDMAFCSIITVKNGFVASGFSSFESPIIEHDLNNVNESVDEFVKAVFSK